MVSVTARKIRDHGAERTSGALGRVYTGYLISYPYIGRGKYYTVFVKSKLG